MKFAVMLAALAGTACVASAINYTATAQPIEGGGGYLDRNATVYSSLTGGYASFPAATGPVGFDDYQTTNVADNVSTIAKFSFVGGVQTVGGVMTFQFFDNSGPTPTFFSSFDVALPQAGAFIWTINLGTLPDGSDSSFVVPTNGVVQAVVDAATTGRFFLTAAGNPAPLAGTNNPAYGSGSTLTRNQAFSLEAVPTPGALALMGLGGLAAARRRR